MSHVLVALGCLAVLASGAKAALDPEIDKPYTLQVVLSLAEHRVFTPLFREQVERDVRDNLQAAFGELVKVTVIRDHPLLAEVRSKGLRQVLDGWRFVSDLKTHFVLLDFKNGQYELQARQHDGQTGIASPEVRQTQVGDRHLVARTAALMVERDFGVLATLPALGNNPPQGQELTITLKGGRLSPTLGGLVREGHVFLLTQISQTAAGQRTALVPGAVLQVVKEPRDGTCVCRLYYRYAPALPDGSGVLGFRALKAATTESRLRLRVVSNDSRREQLNALSVALGKGPADMTETQATNLNEPFQSMQMYRHLAFARISKQGQLIAGPFPVPIFSDAPQLCPVRVDPAAEKRGTLEARLRAWSSRWYDAALVGSTIVTDFNTRIEKAPETALKVARQGLGQLRPELLNLDAELRAIQVEAGKMGLSVKQEIAEGDQRLRELSKRYHDLEHSLSELANVLAKQKDPKIKEWQTMLHRAHLLEAELEIDQALTLYEKVLAESNPSKDLREYVAKLKREWMPRDDEHREARAFAYDIWPRLTDAARIQERLSDAVKHAEVCRKARDQRTLRKLLRVSKDFVARLAKEAESLRPEAGDDDRKAADTIIEVTAGLGKLIRALSEDVEKPANP